MRRMIKLNGRRAKIKTIQMNAPESLYKKIESIRKQFKEINGIDITTIQATDFFAKKTRIPKIPCLFKNDKTKKKG